MLKNNNSVLTVIKQLTISTTLIAIFLLQGCTMLWPYKSDFDCKIPKGEHCKSLYEVNQLADTGKYDPNFHLCGQCDRITISTKIEKK